MQNVSQTNVIMNKMMASIQTLKRYRQVIKRKEIKMEFAKNIQNKVPLIMRQY